MSRSSTLIPHFVIRILGLFFSLFFLAFGHLEVHFIATSFTNRSGLAMQDNPLYSIGSISFKMAAYSCQGSGITQSNVELITWTIHKNLEKF